MWLETLTKEELISEIKKLTGDEQIAWMLALGEFLTISARSSYKTDGEPGQIEDVMGHNEIQHRLFARIRDLRAGREWTVESFVGVILEIANTYGVAGDVGWAIRKSLSTKTAEPL